MSELQLRPPHAHELPELLLRMETFNRSEGIAWQPDRIAPALQTLLDDPSLGAVRWIVEGEIIVGYLVWTWGYDLEWAGRDAFLTELQVDAAHRGRGVGARALQLAEQALQAEGAGALHPMVRHDNPAALQLYERAGYTVPPRIFMTKALG